MCKDEPHDSPGGTIRRKYRQIDGPIAQIVPFLGFFGPLRGLFRTMQFYHQIIHHNLSRIPPQPNPECSERQAYPLVGVADPIEQYPVIYSYSFQMKPTHKIY